MKAGGYDGGAGVYGACALPGGVRSEMLTNDMVVALVQAGLGDEAVIAKVRASAAHYALSTDDLISLKKRGVPGAVIAAMIDAGTSGPVSAKAAFSPDSPDPLMPHPSGIYMLMDGVPPVPDGAAQDQDRRDQQDRGHIGLCLYRRYRLPQHQDGHPEYQRKDANPAIAPDLLFLVR